jgi:hypothetical protein
MSYSILSYISDSTEIQNVWNSKDDNLYSKISNLYKDDLLKSNNYFQLKSPNKFENILEDIIAGEIKHNNLNYAYGYVYELLCKFYGELIDTSHLDWSYNPPYLCVFDPKYSAFIPIPFSSDFPHIRSIKNAELKKIKNEYLTIKSDYYNEEEIILYREYFNFIFDYAMKKNKDLILFNY